MKIYDEALENVLENPDLEKGYTKTARRFVEHHEATELVFHYEVMEGTVTEECPDGLRQEVVDTHARAAWDEYEDVLVYMPYTEEELAERNKPTTEERIAAVEQRADALEAVNDDLILMMADLIGGEG